MQFTVEEISKFYFEKADEKGIFLGKEHLQAYLFLTYAWHLVFRNDRIFDQQFRATRLGPKLDDFSKIYDRVVTDNSLGKESNTEFRGFYKSFLSKLWDKYEFFSGEEIQILVNSENSPNQKVLRQNSLDTIYLNDFQIKSYYASRLPGMKNFSFDNL